MKILKSALCFALIFCAICTISLLVITPTTNIEITQVGNSFANVTLTSTTSGWLIIDGDGLGYTGCKTSNTFLPQEAQEVEILSDGRLKVSVFQYQPITLIFYIIEDNGYIAADPIYDYMTLGPTVMSIYDFSLEEIPNDDLLWEIPIIEYDEGTYEAVE